MSLLKEDAKEQLKKRGKSLAWRAGMMLAALIAGFALDNLDLLNLPGEAVLLLGLILGEVSKFLNSKAK